MSESDSTPIPTEPAAPMSPASPVPPPETQSQRWLKYGSNVLLSILVVIALAFLVTWIAHKFDWRADTTLNHENSLKPQTVNVIRDLKDPIELVSLYAQKQPAEGEQNYAQRVADLLHEYQRAGRNIDVQIIDPDTEPQKVDALFKQVGKKYGNDVSVYRSVLDDFPKAVEKINKLSKDEEDQLDKLPDVKDQEIADVAGDALGTIAALPQLLDQAQIAVHRELQLKTPNYKGAAEGVQAELQIMSDNISEVLGKFKTMQDSPKAPPEIRDYMKTSAPRYQAIKKICDDLLDRLKKLGELKQLDELRQEKVDSIVVMGPGDLKILPFKDVWQTPPNTRMDDADTKPKLEFAGEQQVSTAILGLTTPHKPKILFVRGSGPPMINSIPQFGYTGPMSVLADRLRQYNFDVNEKDVSGQWQMEAMQLQQERGVMLPPEASDAELKDKDTIWVVIDSAQPPQMMAPPPPIAGSVKDHLKAGGSAIILVDPGSDNLGTALSDYGIVAHSDDLAIHAYVAGAARSPDRIEGLEPEQAFFVLNRYGDGPLANALNSLDTFMPQMVPITVDQVNGVKAWPFLPVPEQPQAWGVNVDKYFKLGPGEHLNYSATTDLKPPFYAGAMAEKTGGNRVVVVGSIAFAADFLVNHHDYEIRRRTGNSVLRYPGNGELFMDSIFWLAKMDTMIAISPKAMEVSRIVPISDTALAGLRWGILIVGLPLAVILSGLFVYIRRQD